MRLRYDPEAQLTLVEPDDPEELIAVDTDDLGIGRIVLTKDPTVQGLCIVQTLYGEGLIPRLKKELGIT